MLRFVFCTFSLLFAASNVCNAQPYSKADILIVEENLAYENYEVGEVDGDFTAETAAAISLYEKDWQLPVTGKISDMLLAR